MLCDDDILDGFPSDERPIPLDRLPYARRVAELVRPPGALEHWRHRSRECYQESRRRDEQHAAWAKKRSKFFTWPAGGNAPSECETRAPGWEHEREILLSPDGTQIAFVEGWVPPELAIRQEPYHAGLLPFSRRHPLSLADCYFVLALIHDDARRDGLRINPFAPDAGRQALKDWDLEELCEWLFWDAHRINLSGLHADHQLALDDCMARVEADLRDGALGRRKPRPSGKRPRPARATKTGRPPDTTKPKVVKYVRGLRNQNTPWKEIPDAVFTRFRVRYTAETLRGYLKDG